jgi:HAD superfamily hydrolase (TIGR01458 family)
VDLPVDEDELLTAPAMAGAWVRYEHLGARCWLVGSDEIVADLGAIDLVGGEDSPELVILGGAGPEFDYPTVNRVFRLATDGVPMVAMHRNLYWRTDAGLQLDTGAFLGAIEQASGSEATIVGKPAPACFAAALELVGLPSEQVMMVGDDLEADVAGAQRAGIEAVLVRTGKFREEALAGSPVEPDHLLDSFADVPTLIGLS